MRRSDVGILIFLGGIAAYLYYQSSQTSDTVNDSAVSFSNDPLASIKEAVVSSTVGWKNTGDASIWLPALNAAEEQFGIPVDLLARIAYEESHFRTEIIDGTLTSPAGALGLMQLEPQFFASVRVTRPFTSNDTLNQINDAAQDLVTNYHSLGNWPQAVAAYNAGLHTIQTGNASAANKAATAKYVADILADVPAVA